MEPQEMQRIAGQRVRARMANGVEWRSNLFAEQRPADLAAVQA